MLSKLLRKIVKIPNTPYALEWDKWKEFDREAKTNYPVRFFFNSTLPGYLQDDRTGLCFNYYHNGALVLLTEVPCTDKVLGQIQE